MLNDGPVILTSAQLLSELDKTEQDGISCLYNPLKSSSQMMTVYFRLRPNAFTEPETALEDVYGYISNGTFAKIKFDSIETAIHKGDHLRINKGMVYQIINNSNDDLLFTFFINRSNS